jgi:hypothetical protein
MTEKLSFTSKVKTVKTLKTVKTVKTETIWCAVDCDAGDALPLGYDPAPMGNRIPTFRGIIDQLRNYQLLKRDTLARNTCTHLFVTSLLAK